MPVLVVDPEVASSDDEDAREYKERQQILKTLNVLDPAQQPELIFCRNLKEWELQHPEQKVAVTFPIDDLEHHPHVVDPEKHYELLSKRGLAKSGLRTPLCKIIDFEPPTSSPKDCCKICREHISTDEIPSACNGIRKSWLDSQTELVVQQILAHPVPYVLKLQQTVSGAGTFIIQTAEERSHAADHIATAVLRFLLTKITPENAHLHPATILLSDLVTDIKDTISVTFFVTSSGQCVHLCCSRQQMSGGNQWIGSTICYGSEQKELEKRTLSTTIEVTAFLHKSGYTGPVGMDILEDSQGVQWVVDLNVRTPSSLLLGPLRGHFTSRKFSYACLVTKELSIGREDFLDKFQSSLREGRLIIVAWFEESATQSTASIVLGAEDEDALGQFAREIDKLEVDSS